MIDGKLQSVHVHRHVCIFWNFQDHSDMDIIIYGGFNSHGGSPSHHPFLDGILHEINHPVWGSPHL